MESRLRLLILALEQPPMVFCHPIANCFHRSPPVIPDFCRSPAPHCAADWEPVQEVLASQRIQLQQQQQQPQQTTASSSSPSVGTTLTTSTTSASASVSASSTRSPSPNVTPAVAQVGGVEPSDAQVCDDSAFVTLDNGCSANGEGVAPTREPTSKTTNSPPPVKTKAGKNGKGEKNSNNNNSNSNNEDEVSCYTSTFIIGLSFQNGTKFVDVGPAIQV